MAKRLPQPQKKGFSPQEHVDRLSQRFRSMTDLVQAKADRFIRTSASFHQKGAQHLWKAIEEKGFLYKGSYKGWYAVRDEAFYKESDLKDGKAPTGAPVTWVEEPCYFFRLSAFEEKLLAFYEANPGFVQPKERLNEAISWVKQGLQDLAVSRSTFSWGVPIPGDADHVMYVWMDALSNYINALGYPSQTEKFKKFWPSSHHVIGKDILRFHAIYWPAFLMAANLKRLSSFMFMVGGQWMGRKCQNPWAMS